jgi:hypothetical protein
MQMGRGDAGSWSGGGSYEGQFRLDRFHGQGTYVDPEGTVVTTVWMDGLPAKQTKALEVEAWVAPAGQESGPCFIGSLGDPGLLSLRPEGGQPRPA